MKAAVVVIILLVIGFIAWQAVGGQDVTTPNAPNPDLPVPDNPGEAADDLWDTVDGAPQWVWTQVAPILIVGIALAMIAKKFPKASYILLGLFFGFFFFVVVMGSN